MSRAAAQVPPGNAPDSAGALPQVRLLVGQRCLQTWKDNKARRRARQVTARSSPRNLRLAHWAAGAPKWSHTLLGSPPIQGVPPLDRRGVGSPPQHQRPPFEEQGGPEPQPRAPTPQGLPLPHANGRSRLSSGPQVVREAAAGCAGGRIHCLLGRPGRANSRYRTGQHRRAWHRERAAAPARRLGRGQWR